MLAITKEFLGTGMHLIQDSCHGQLTWSSKIPTGSLVLGNADNSTSIGPAFEIFKAQLPSIIPQEFRKAMDIIGNNDINIPWHHVVPRKKYLKAIEDALGVMWELFSKLQKSSYMSTFIDVSNFINSMQRARIDTTKINNYIKNEKNASVLSTLASFQPAANEMALKVTYSNCRTVTGRMTVLQGPRILTMPVNYRDIISSTYKDGLILELDFKSLEPRIALTLAGKDSPYDVYDEISKKLFSEKLKRSEVKIAVLCALYGASTQKLNVILDSQFNAGDVIRRVKEYFCYNDITNSLRQKYDRDGFISNAFGRPIFCESNRGNILYSNLVQSTASDAAILGFKKLLDEIYFISGNVRPLFIVHDALILDTGDDSWLAQIHNFVELDNIGKLYFEHSLVA